MKTFTVTIGIPVYNEEKNIEKLLTALVQQKTKTCRIKKIWVIASGCTDKTLPKAKFFAQKHPSVHIIEQKQREGKSSAINEFFKKTEGEIAIIASGDILPKENTVEELCLPFQKSHIGMTGSHPTPTNPKKGFANSCVHTLWELHHEVAKIKPKCGEMIAFRNIIKTIPKESPVDEASIEKAVQDKGFSIAYAPKAIVYNKGPQTFSELFEQRRRINAGHLWLKRSGNYTVGTNNKKTLIKAVFKYLFKKPAKLFTLTGLIFIEALSQFAARRDIKKSKSYTIWKPLPSTKKLP